MAVETTAAMANIENVEGDMLKSRSRWVNQALSPALIFGSGSSATALKKKFGTILRNSLGAF